MMNLFRSFLVLMLLLTPMHTGFNGAASAQVEIQATLDDVVGRYRVEGRNPDGSAYRGTLEVSDDLGSALFVWKVAGRTYRGTGNFVDNTLVVDWGDTSPVIYRVYDDGSLFGTWANGAASEKLTRR